MKNILVLCLMVAGLCACRQKQADGHAHNPDGSHPQEEGPASLSYTLYTDSTELFVEFKPLIVGQSSRFAAHLTHLGERFRPYINGKVTVSLIQGEKGLRATADSVASPGIFRLALQPAVPGSGKLIFEIETQGINDRITIDNVQVYPDKEAALKAQEPAGASSDISFLKEQAWKIEFANAPIQPQTIYDVVKTSGQILPAPGDEVTVAARSNGIVRFIGSGNVVGAAVKSGQALFSITGGQIAFENVDAAKQTARAELSSAKAEYDRASELIKDRLITQREFQDAKLRYEQSQIALSNLSRNYSGGNKMTAPISGFIRSILVSEGQYINAGQPLATITKNQRLLLRAEVSLRDADRIRNIREANFTLVQSKATFNTKQLVSVGRATGEATPFIPVTFSVVSQPEILPGAFAEVYLKAAPIPNTLAVPTSALVEEQGIFYVYVQTEGESFQKREVKTGVSDGQLVQILSGIQAGERVVTKGGYQIKLSQASGTMPAHGHEH